MFYYLNAQIIVDQDILSSITWDNVSQEYLITKSINIADSAELTIDKGVRVVMFDEGSIHVFGKLNLNGKLNDSIFFEYVTSKIQNYQNSGIQPMENAEINGNYCVFKNFKSVFSANYLANLKFRISNSSFENNFKVVTGWNKSKLYFEDCKFLRNYIGIEKNNRSVFNCEFEGNEFAIIGLGKADSVINCQFHNNSVIALEGFNAVIKNCHFTKNNIAIEYASRYPNVGEIRENTIMDNNYGIKISYFYYSVPIIHNTICGNNIYNVKNEKFSDIDISNNCWCNYASDVRNTIYDHSSDSTLGYVNITPVQTYCIADIDKDNIQLSGSIYNDDELIRGAVVLLFEKTETSFLARQYSKVTWGKYYFEELKRGSEYLCYAIPNQAKYPHLTSSYYGNKELWQEGYIIKAEANIEDVDIRLYSRIIEGSSSIAGKVNINDINLYEDSVYNRSWFSQRAISVDEGTHVIQNIPILIKHIEKDQYYLTLTNGVGQFQFKNLQSGNYKIFLQKPGYKHLNEPIIKLDESMEHIEGINIHLDKKGIVVKVPNLRAITNKFIINPNPVHDLLNVEYELEANSNVHVHITDIINKQTIKKIYNSYAGKNNIGISVSELKNGLYTISIQTSDSFKTKSFIKN